MVLGLMSGPEVHAVRVASNALCDPTDYSPCTGSSRWVRRHTRSVSDVLTEEFPSQFFF